MGERFTLRRPNKKELAAGAVGLFGAAYLANQELQKPESTQTDISGIHQPIKDSTTTQRHDHTPETPTSTTLPDHQTFRAQSSNAVLDRLARTNERFSVTTTVSVDGKMVDDQFFGISFKNEDGNYQDLGTVYPDEKTGTLSFNPGEELNDWVVRHTGSELTSFSTTDPDQLVDAAQDAQGLADLMQEEKAGNPVNISEIAEQLMTNKTITTEEAREEQEKNAADTGQ